MSQPPPRAKAGRIELVCGCMFSGKSERLVRRVLEARAKGLVVATFKHASDDRYARKQIVTHSGQRIEAVAAARAWSLLDLAGEADLVVIDEAQFFDRDLVEVCRQLADQGRQVLVAGLDRDSWGRPFGPLPQIEAIADLVTRTHATCARCGAQAEYTQRLTPITSRKMIGGPESYEPRCGRCFQPPPIELRR